MTCRLRGLRADLRLLLRARRAGTAGPFKVTAALTWRCDHRCLQCSIWSRPRGDELDAAAWRRVWRQGRAHLSWIDLTGGEPTLSPDFVEIGRAAIEELPSLAMLHFPTNGNHPRRVARAGRALLAGDPARLAVTVSVDGPPGLNDRLRGQPGAFERSVESFRLLREAGVPTWFGITLGRDNVAALEPTWQALSAAVPGMSWRDLHINFAHHSEHYYGNGALELPHPRAVRRAWARVVRRRGVPRDPTALLETLYLGALPDYQRSGTSPWACTALAGNCYVDPAGTVYACTMWDRPVGSVAGGDSLAEVLGAEEARAARREVELERCPGCWTGCEANPSILAGLGLRGRTAPGPGGRCDP